MKLINPAPINLNYSNPNPVAQNNLVVGGFQANQDFYNSLIDNEVIQDPTFIGGISPWSQTALVGRKNWQALSEWIRAILTLGETTSQIISQNISLTVGQTYNVNITVHVVAAGSITFYYTIDGTPYSQIMTTGVNTLSFQLVATNASTSVSFETTGAVGDIITVRNFSLQISVIAGPEIASLFAQQNQTEPYTFNYLHIRCNTDAQYYLQYYWVYKSVEGRYKREPFEVKNYVNPYQFQPDVQIEFPKPIIFDGNHWLEISSILPNTQFIMMFDYLPSVAAKYREPNLINNPKFPNIRQNTQPQKVQTSLWGFVREFFRFTK